MLRIQKLGLEALMVALIMTPEEAEKVRKRIEADLKHCNEIRAAYLEQLPELVKHYEGKWTVFGKNKEPLGFWNTAEEGMVAGQQEYRHGESYSVRLISKNSSDYEQIMHKKQIS